MAISPVTGFVPFVPPTPPAAPASPGAGASGAASDDFMGMVTKGLESLQQAHASADSLAQQAATGSLTDVHDYMIAATQANLATELTVNVRNRAVEAFNDIMRMPI